MEQRRLLIAIGLMLAVIVLTNILFPPVRPVGTPGGLDSAALERLDAAGRDTVDLGRDSGDLATEPEPEVPDAFTGVPEAEDSPEGDVAAQEPLLPAGDRQGDTIRVTTPLYRLAFVTRGAALVSAELPAYLSYAEADPSGASAELIRPGDRFFGYVIAAGADTLDLSGRHFEASATEVSLNETDSADSLTFRHVVGRAESGPIVFRVTYHFEPGRYRIRVHGAFEGIGARGFTLMTSMGEGLRTNEANSKEDYGQLAFVTRGRHGIRSEKVSSVEEGVTEAAAGGPFNWVAVKNKYFVVALLAPDESPGFGGLLVRGLPAAEAAHITATLPVPARSPQFVFDAYLGPQDYGRLKAVGHDLQNVNPVGWRWLQPVIRPLVAIVMAILSWMHVTLSLAWGWVLILFGVLMRVVLFPLYQKSMRAQMAQMRVQPLMQDIRTKYKDDPQKMQQEMMRLYKEHNINPLAGCLPMLLPFPILITLFFVFQNTIEFRGVPFLWLPDLSLKDPLYIVPLLMGGSMFLLTWIGQRGMESTAQTKMLGWGMPILFTFLFANFPSGLNLYYATSNIASLPQQLYIARERQKARPGVTAEADGDGTDAGSPEAGAGGRKRTRKAEPQKQKKGRPPKKKARGRKPARRPSTNR